MKLLKAINELSDSETFSRIKVVARNRSKFVNRDVSLAPFLVELCKLFDLINERQLTGRELYIFNELIARFLGSLLQQEMDNSELRWK